MKRLIAALLAVSMAAQVSACSSLPTASAGTVSSGPVAAGPARVSSRSVNVVAADRSQRIDATTVAVSEPVIPATEFWGGPMAIVLRVVMIATNRIIAVKTEVFGLLDFGG